ncbi:hypothetical protein OEJ37_13370 [Burkholderia sp. BKH01]|nr:hypothetical protein [Burkholderia sp. BKH01]
MNSVAVHIEGQIVDFAKHGAGRRPNYPLATGQSSAPGAASRRPARRAPRKLNGMACRFGSAERRVRARALTNLLTERRIDYKKIPEQTGSWIMRKRFTDIQ